MAEKIYAKGLRTFAPRQGAPEFVLGTLIITEEELLKWFKDNRHYASDYNGMKQFKFSVLKSDKTGINLQLDMYKKKEDNSATVASNQKRSLEEEKEFRVPDKDNSLPF